MSAEGSLLTPDLRKNTLLAPTVQTVNIPNFEFIPRRVISARTIKVYCFSGCQHPDEARHLRGGSTLVDLQSTEVLADDPVNIEPKNAGVRELHPLRTRDLGPKPTCVDDRGSGKNLKFSGICPGIPVHPYGAVIVEEYLVSAAEEDLCAPLRCAYDRVLREYAPWPGWFPVHVSITFDVCDHNIRRVGLGGGH